MYNALNLFIGWKRTQESTYLFISAENSVTVLLDFKLLKENNRYIMNAQIFK